VIGATNWRAKNFALRQSQSAKAGSSDNLDKNPALTVEQNAAMIEPDWNKPRTHSRKRFMPK